MTASAVVTGGASGLGRATSAMLVRRGIHVVIADRNVEQGKRTADDIGARFVETDVTDEDSVAAAVEAAAGAAPLRVAVSCAGVTWSQRLLDRAGTQLPTGTFTDVVQINLVGTFLLMRSAAAAMAASDPDVDGERGVIVNTASIAAFDGQSGQLAYAASKAGVVGMTLPAARDLSPVGIRVCAIAPGVIETPMVAGLDEKNRTELKRIIQQPKRPGRPEEFAALVGDIIDNADLNGEVIRLDGGLRMPPR